ncbi:MAG: carboxymuconolactone decarboxylase family protein [Planctomycetota bacterium]|jgi:AhpD family alkylhydroperoxidase
MKNNAHDHYDRWPDQVQTMRAAAPTTSIAFGTMFRKLMGDGALSVREKELIALSIGMAVRCEACIFSHVEKALQAGATPEQILDAAGVVVMMQGGPGYVYVPKVIEALDALGAHASA